MGGGNAFNRSFLELKFIFRLFSLQFDNPFQSVLSGIEIMERLEAAVRQLQAFNRSFLELKLPDVAAVLREGRNAFNRSFLELKWHADADQHAPHVPFNRSFLELK